MSEWKKVNLLEVTSRIGDGLHGTPKYDDNGDYYFINGNNLQNGKIILKEDTKKISENEYLKIKKELNNRTIFVAINGTLGNVGVYSDERIALGKSACYLNINDNVNKYFIRYVLESQHFQKYAELFATGATIKNLSLKAVRKYPFLLPPLSTQNKIAKILSNCDDLIENNLKRIMLLEESAILTYEEWFLRFRIDGKKLEVDSETGLPFGWKQKKLTDVIALNPLTAITRGVEQPFIPMGSISETNMLIDAVEMRVPSGGTRFQNLDTLLARITPSLENGKTGFVQCLKENEVASGSTEFIVMRATDVISPYYIYSLARTEAFREIAIQSMSGSDGRQRVKVKVFEKILLNIPTEEIRDKYHFSMKKIFDEIQVLANQTQFLKEARDILLPRLMTGMIDVEDMETAV